MIKMKKERFKLKTQKGGLNQMVMLLVENPKGRLKQSRRVFNTTSWLKGMLDQSRDLVGQIKIVGSYKTVEDSGIKNLTRRCQISSIQASHHSLVYGYS